MDTGLKHLYAAAHAGNIDSLRELLQEDELLLERAVSTTEASDNPLHIAAIRGYAGFAKEIVHRNRNLAREVNRQGLTPLHLAAVHGHIQVAEELIQVIKDLLSQPDIEVNPVNSAGLTPLDVLLVTNHEMGDLYLGEMLRAAGGKTAKELSASEINIVEHSSSIDAHNTSQATLLSTPSKKMTRNRSKIQKPSENMEKNLIVVATLVATVTFAAALNPPGGSIQMPFDDSDRTNPNWIRNWENMDTLYPAGSPVYLWHLRKFFMYDYFALFASVSVILLCLPGVIPRSYTVRQLLLLVLWSSVFFMVLAFTSALNILLYREKNYTKFPWFTHFFDIWRIFFAGVSASLFYNVLISLIASVAGKVKKWLPISVSNNVCVPKVKRVIRWAKIKRKLSSLSVMAISILVGWGVSWAISDMASSAYS